METLVILAAVAATLLACIFVATLSRGPRQAPLRLPREEEWSDNADAVSKVLNAAEPSPIDRGAQVLDIRVVGDGMAGGPVFEGPVIEGEVVKDPAAEARGSGAGTSPRFDAEELDSRMLDQLLDQQNRALKQALEPDTPPSSEAKDRPAR